MVKKKRNGLSIISSFVLSALIILSILELFDFLSIELRFIVKVCSILLFGFLFYKISISHLVFGNKSKQIDVFVLIGFFCFSIKNIIGLITTNFYELSKTSLFYDFFFLMVNNRNVYEYYGFVAGAIILLLTSAYFCFVKIGKNSLMHILHCEKKLHGKDIFKRFFISLMVLLAFYILIFNLAIEWVVLVMHGPVLLILFLFYLIITLNKNRFNARSFVSDVAFSLERSYERLLRMFHSKRILLGLAGLVTLHLVTDFFVFIIPYLTGHFSPNYLSLIHAKPHAPIITLFLKDLAIGSNLGGLIFVYLFNLIAISVVLLTPFYMWLRVFKKKHIRFSKLCLSVSYTSLFVYIVMPLFTLHRLKKGFYGIDIITRTVSNFNILNMIILVGAAIFVLVYFLGYSKFSYKIVNKGLAFFVLIFAFIYLFNYFISISTYYVTSLSSFPDVFVKIILSLFFVITLLFYIIGYGALVNHVMIEK